MIKIRTFEDQHTGSLNIAIIRYRQRADGTMIKEYATPINLQFKQIEEDGLYESFLRLSDYDESREFLRELSDSLIYMGFRDKKTDSTAEIKRLETHLNDMRSLVFKKEKN